MRQAILSVDEGLAERFGMSEVIDCFREAGSLDLEILSCEGTTGVVRGRFETELDEDRLDELEAVDWWERVLDSGEGCVYLVGFDAPDAPSGVDSCPDETLPVEHLEVDERGLTFDVTGPQAVISEFISEHEAAGLNLTLKQLRGYRGGESSLDALTSRQREVIETAYDVGYYDVPRSAPTTEVAAELDLDDSTVAEHIQRAERNLVGTVLDGTA